MFLHIISACFTMEIIFLNEIHMNFIPLCSKWVIFSPLDLFQDHQSCIFSLYLTTSNTPKLPSFGFFNTGQIPNLGDFWEVYRHTGAGARGPGLVATITFVSCHQVGLVTLVTIFSSPKSWFCYFLPQISGSTDSLCWFFFSNAVGDSTWGLMCPWQVGESFKLAKGCEDLLQIWRWITFGFT